MARPREYTAQVTRVVEGVIRRTRCLRQARRELGEQYEGPWSEDGPSIKTMRRIHREMINPPELEDKGGHPPYYSEEQRAEMARLAGRYGVTGNTGAMAILRARNGTRLAGLRKAKIFPKPVQVSQPTISEAAKLYDVKVRGAA